MNLPTETLTLYEVFWGERRYLWDLSENYARTRLESSWAYGEVDEEDDDCFALGTHGAEHDNEEGWRIVPREIQVTHFSGEIKGSFEKRETVHLIWQCPYCEQFFSEDVEQDTEYPLLVSCSCKKTTPEKYYLVQGERPDNDC